MLITNVLNLKLYSFLSKYRRYIPIIIDILIAVESYFISFAIIGLESIKLKIFMDTVLIYMAVFIETFYVMKIYKNMWRFSGVEDIFRCLNASVAANIIFYVITKLLNLNILLYIYLFAFLISSFSAISARLIYRAILINVNNRLDKYHKYKNTMIIGAGFTTAAILNGIKSKNRNQKLAEI